MTLQEIIDASDNIVFFGGNAFIVNSVSEGMKVSVKNPELEYSVGNASMKDGYWDWCI